MAIDGYTLAVAGLETVIFQLQGQWSVKPRDPCVSLQHDPRLWKQPEKWTAGVRSVDSSSQQTEVMWKVLLTLSLLCWGLCSSVEISYRDKNGGEVDWYILYKVPKLNNVPLTGLEYFYIDEKIVEQNNIINDPNGVLARTLKPLFNPPNNFGYISYNDQPPDGSQAPSVFGHSKGIVMTDKSTGVWLLHSTPNFPYDRKHGKLWPDSGSRNAQTFICVNFKYNQFQEIGKHLQYIRAFPFDHDIPNDFHSELKSVVKREDFEPNKPFLPQELKSRGGQDFKSFAKYSSGMRDADDLYFLIAHDLKSNLSARSWEASRKHEESDCRDDWIVYIIDYVGMTLSVEKKRTKRSVDSSSQQTEVMWKVLLTLSLLCWGLCSSVEISCRDKNGGEVDWYILYKVPKLNNVPLTGLEYFYIDAKTMEQNNIINDPNGVLERTLKPLLNPPKNFGYISYNDQPPGCTAKNEFGHSKGIVMTDKSTGVWLLHSTPSFPYDRKHGVLWPESGSRNAQTFICVNFNYNQFQKIGKHLQYIRAFPFDHDIPEDFYSELKSVVKREDLEPNKPFLPQELKSRGGQRIKIFAKYSTDRNADDLYFLMARDLKRGIQQHTAVSQYQVQRFPYIEAAAVQHRC
ncbi:hypothetical protein SKAU_G00046720 [Synaphobranchus kaupii]|uniref:Deoxyribonuclease-2-alpha n=1 Tax=Synaphobranchus kaupii TaxID=118154 RepID=A0A9Q1G278_SYNKA|nr:hypothetical protein SKAU_G00046720 [Synaphobranchus kaupii]